jgi:predicted transposase YbfD/YdcC
VRSPWEIAHGVHWVVDGAVQEDQSQVRQDHGAATFAVLRHLALNVLKQESTAKGEIKAKRVRAG